MDPLPNDERISLETLYARYDAVAAGRTQGNSPDLHRAIITRLAENRVLAGNAGWTACSLDRLGGGRLGLWGVAPGGATRTEVPDLRHVGWETTFRA